MRAGDEPEPRAVDGDLAAVLVEPFEFDVGRVHLPAAADADPEPLRPGARDRDAVRRAAQFQVERTDFVAYLRTAAERGRQQPLPPDLLVVLVGLDRRRGERDRGMPRGDETAFGADAVDPAGVRAGVDHLGLVEQVEHEALVGGAALDEHGRLGHRPAQPGERLVAVAAVGDDLGDHRVEVGGDRVALADAGVDPDARARGQQQPGDAAGGRREVAVRVLGVEPRFDGVPGLRRLRAFELAAGRDVQLQPHQVGAGGDLGDRVFHLEPGVDLEEGEHPVAGVVEEFDGARAAVADRDREPLGRRLQLGGLVRPEHRRGGLLDDLLVAPLHRAVADAERPRGLAVGDHLDLDVPRAGDQALQEHDAAAERAQRFLAGALVGLGEIARRLDLADAAPAAARGGLEHQRVADLVARGEGFFEGRDLAAAPRSDRDADLLGDQLRADLVAELAHRVGAGADEGDADLLAQLRERRVLGDEAPADPRGVGLGLDQCLLQFGEVEVGPRGGGAERVRDVGFADESRGGVRVRVERDRLDPSPGLGGRVPDGVDQPHRGLSAVDDGDAIEHGQSLPVNLTAPRTAGDAGPAGTSPVFVVHIAPLPPGTPMSRMTHAAPAGL
ncbi:hypothetical protein A4R44_05639 [Amycolatopsis sp. M39]|nr:hypothetical protein A4R44_05639 [Amycolatopsis sp. M39]